jgi:hypothetical protein
MADEHQVGITTLMIKHQDVFGGKGTTVNVKGAPKVGRITLEPDGNANVKMTLFEK